MGADDAADAIADLPQGRRQAVLGLLPSGQRVKVITLMRFSPSSAGGLMGLEFLALPGTLTVGDALVTIPVIDADRRILGLITVDDVLETTLPDDWRQRHADIMAPLWAGQ